MTPGGVSVGEGSAAALLMNRIRKVVLQAPATNRLRSLFDAAFSFDDEKITAIISKLKTKNKWDYKVEPTQP